MTDVQIEAGTLTASLADRTLSGLLVPFNEVGNTNLGKFTVEAGAFKLPRDPSVVTLNLDHDRENPIGRAVVLAEEADGIHATFKFADTDEADAALRDFRDGTRSKLSVEAKGMVLRAGRALAGSIFGAAVVAKGAFPSAALMAADVGDLNEPVPDAEEEPESVETDVDALRKALEPYGLTVAPLTPETPEASAEELSEPITITEPEEPEEDKEAPVANATVPTTLSASAPGSDSINKETLLATIAGAARTNDSSLMAALQDVKISGANAVGTGVVVPEYVGEVWSGRSFQRKVIPLITNGTLTSLSQKGWRFTTAPEVAEWAGNKAEIPSSIARTEEVTYGITKFAGGWDIAREFIDFGETAVIDRFLSLAADSYAKKSDAKVLNDLVAGATVGAVGTSPDGVGLAMGKIVRGALRVITADAVPSYALVAPDVYEELVFTKRDDVLEFLSMSIGLESGSLDSFKIVPHTGLAAGTVLVGAKEAAGAYEMSGSPIRVNALDLARGGFDEALFGYISTRIEYPTGLQLVTNNA